MWTDDLVIFIYIFLIINDGVLIGHLYIFFEKSLDYLKIELFVFIVKS